LADDRKAAIVGQPFLSLFALEFWPSVQAGRLISLLSHIVNYFCIVNCGEWFKLLENRHISAS
jgi:hypothetical protein